MKKRVVERVVLSLLVFFLIVFVNKNNIIIADAALPSRMYVDSPFNNQISNNTDFDLVGWSLNSSGVKEVQVYIDGKFLKNAAYGLAREDVDRVYPGYPNGNKSGFSYHFDIRSISPGTHKISAVSVGNDGTKLQVDVSVTVNTKQPLMNLEAPSDNFSTTQRDMTVGGWAVNDSGIKAIKYYLNDKLVGTTLDGIPRPDVNTVYPGFRNGATSGYSLTFNAMKFVTVGTQNVTLKVTAVGNDGTSTTMTKKIILNKLTERLTVDAPLNGGTAENSVNVVGWALNASGVKDVNVYLDNVLKGKAVYGAVREDVNRVYPGYTGGSKSGFSYNLDISRTAPGNHTIKVTAVGNDGKTITQSIVIKNFGTIEYTYFNYTIDGMVDIQNNVGAVYQDPKTWQWVPADPAMIRKYTDPSNITNDDYRKYELLKLSYNEGVSVTDLNNILKAKGVLQNKGQVFLNGGKNNNVNPVYLISHALLETGNGTSNLSKGILVSSVNGVPVTPKTVYNVFGIGAFDSDPDRLGSEYAYKQGWDTIDKAITGGAGFISKGYINSSTKQNTLYKMRWNPASPGNHQYATDVKWAYNQVYNIKKLLSLCNNTVIYFNIPVFSE